MMFLIKIARTWPAYPRLQTNPDGTCPSPSGILHELLVQVSIFIEGSLEVKLLTIWRDEKQSREEA